MNRYVEGDTSAQTLIGAWRINFVETMALYKAGMITLQELRVRLGIPAEGYGAKEKADRHA